MHHENSIIDAADLSPLVSLIVPVYNCSRFLGQSLESIENQSYRPLEVILYDDCSPDDSRSVIDTWMRRQAATVGTKVCVDATCSEKIILTAAILFNGISVILASGASNHGPGFARNRAISLSTGSLLCHFDSDDMMTADRISKQVAHWKSLGCHENSMIGCNFNRYPLDSTPYYTNWLNSLSDADMFNQRFRECTIICPSWMYTRAQFDKIAAFVATSGRHAPTEVGVATETAGAVADEIETDNTTVTSIQRVRGFVESSEYTLRTCKLKRVPEDLFFFLDHCSLGGTLSKVCEELVTYRYSEGSWALGTCFQDLAQVRVGYIQAWLLANARSAIDTAPLSNRKRKKQRHGDASSSNEMNRNNAMEDLAKESIEFSSAEGCGAKRASCEASKEAQATITTAPSVPTSGIQQVSRDWSRFSIWGYGKDGKKFISMLSAEAAARVTNFIDIDPAKINAPKYYCEASKQHIPVIHFSQATPPFVVCVASKRAGDELERNIASVGPLVEGIDYIHFN